jgi:hypothetical protein
MAAMRKKEKQEMEKFMKEVESKLAQIQSITTSGQRRMMEFDNQSPSRAPSFMNSPWTGRNARQPVLWLISKCKPCAPGPVCFCNAVTYWGYIRGTLEKTLKAIPGDSMLYERAIFEWTRVNQKLAFIKKTLDAQKTYKRKQGSTDADFIQDVLIRIEQY